ncbi:related to PEX29 Peroxisomal integral membrane protein, involved in regulation of peroxisome size and number [Cephalotrichum gorgonifer]|uniref:Related to PEX29 Peroxisomal integral membrane protein, involved in regulation of peroxisome size and number n=1 Tax=Cephalotrichum gorgonifer TaxID=2041049 RepID=A0AAE8MQQ3_9PEZI|nr:related to PEX29 Peroxisomal integral membrane protein, involved in regulation of peroxisome size and number [Cephalotrichum gorgonifer]
MDEYTANLFVNDDTTSAADASSDREDNPPSDAESHATPSKGLRGRVAALRDKAGVQDRLLEKLLQQVIPHDDAGGQNPMFGYSEGAAQSQRPPFNITTMSNNFRRFNVRIGVMFKFQGHVERLLTWRKTSHTLSFLGVYTFVCLDPYLLSVLPLSILIVGVLIPSFLARHPAPPSATQIATEHSLRYSPRGPPTAPAMTVKPVKELSRDFFHNMRDLQNSMEDFTVLHDLVIGAVVPLTNFSDEALSSGLFLALFVGCVTMSIAAHLLPWRLIFLVAGWAVVASSHPAVARALASAQRTHLDPQVDKTRGLLDRWISDDIILDSAPETREVEIFELQRLSPAGEWEPWLFSPSPYDPLSYHRLAGERARGARFFEDVIAPDGWEWSEKKWALDLWSRDWVEERIITGVEVETEGERWVYDIYDENESRTGVVDHATEEEQNAAAEAVRGPSWEEGWDGMGRRGEWRRRRWVRLVKRKNTVGA